MVPIIGDAASIEIVQTMFDYWLGGQKPAEWTIPAYISMRRAIWSLVRLALKGRYKALKGLIKLLTALKGL